MSANQFQLLKTRRFLPFFVTQFLGALNDNLYRAAVLIFVAFTAGREAADTNLLANAAAVLFILPFFLFSATAGQLADKYDKSAVIRYIKAAEIVVAGCALLALLSGNIVAMIAVMALLGTQSTFFGPAKYAILPEQLDAAEIVGGNAQVEMGTFLAILIGTIGGGILAVSDFAAIGLGCLMLSIALAGYLASRKIPAVGAADPDLKIDWNVFRQTWRTINMARSRHSVFLAILGISWFWLLGSVFLTQIPNFTAVQLNGDGTVVTWLLCMFSIGIGVGSLVCERLSGGKVEIGLVPIGALGVTLAGLGLWTLELPPTQTLTWLTIAAHPTGLGLSALLLLMGFFGGLFIVPLYAMVQTRTPKIVRAQIIAANNILNALFMAVGSVFATVMLSVFELQIVHLFVILALMNGAIAIFICQQVPEFLMRMLVWGLSHTMYRVRHDGLHHIPDTGAAIIVCNHVSFVDALLLAGAVRRPIRFIMFKPIYDIPVLNFIFRTGRAIPIIGRREDEAGYHRAFDEIRAGLANGDLLCIFPEGKLTADGAVDEFRPGIERILGDSPVPVIPMALQGLWGSFFSRKDGKPFKARGRFWSRVTIKANPPIAPSEASAATLQQEVEALRGEFA